MRPVANSSVLELAGRASEAESPGAPTWNLHASPYVSTIGASLVRTAERKRPAGVELHLCRHDAGNEITAR